jgi:hypothetical protein
MFVGFGGKINPNVNSRIGERLMVMGKQGDADKRKNCE